MANTDFVDDDLVRHRAVSHKTKGEPNTASAGDGEASRMARQKAQVEDSMAQAAQELERLRQRQENLEKERHALEDLRRRQAEYERGKREILERLNESLISLEKEELRAGKFVELVTSTRQDCRRWLGDIDAINEADWPEDQFREELGKGLARIEDIRQEYNKALARMDSMAREPRAAPTPVVPEEPAAVRPDPGFAFWLKVGFAVSLPLMLVLTILWILFYMHSLGML